MSATATQTAPQVNSDTPYESKFLPKVTSIPLVSSLKTHLFTHIPQAEAISKYVGDHLSAAYSYTNDTPIQPMLIKLDTLAANGVAKLTKEVPAVNTPTDQVLKSTKIDSFVDFLTHYYTASVDFFFSIFNAYKGVFDPVVNHFLVKFETFFDIKVEKEDNQSIRLTRIRKVMVEKVDSRVTPFLNGTKEIVTSIYTEKIAPLIQYPLKQFSASRDKATETFSPIISELSTRFTKAESAAKDAWVKTKPDISRPNSLIPTLKSGLFVVITFGNTLVYTESEKQPANKGVEDQTNGLVSGVELNDTKAKKRPNGMAS